MNFGPLVAALSHPIDMHMTWTTCYRVSESLYADFAFLTGFEVHFIADINASIDKSNEFNSKGF
jgi:hypothetical protein